MSDVLFIHPFNHARPDAIPVGTVGAVNLLSHTVAGRYAEELTLDDIRAARAILLDVHWFFPLSVLHGIVTELKRVNPSAPVVVGGITASFYGKMLLDRAPIDHLVAGDAEECLPQLVDHLVAGEPPPPLPNVWTRGAPPPSAATTSRRDFDAIDWLTLDWFPSYRARTVSAHAAYAREARESIADNTHPILPLTRGCRRSCGFCYGAYQDRVFGRRVRVRSPEALARDLARIEADPELHFVTLFFADVVYMREFADALADRRFDLDAFLFFCGTSDPEVVERMRNVFRGRVVFTIIQPTDLAPLPNERPATIRATEFDGLIRTIRRMERTSAAIFHVLDPPSGAVAEALADEGSNIVSLEAQDWTIVRPDQNALATDLPLEASLEAQLDRVTAASRSFAASNLLRALVPALGHVANPRPLDLGTLVHLRDDPRTDPFERKMLALLVRQILEKRLYGFDNLVLGLARTESRLVGGRVGPSGHGDEGRMHVGLRAHRLPVGRRNRPRAERGRVHGRARSERDDPRHDARAVELGTLPCPGNRGGGERETDTMRRRDASGRGLAVAEGGRSPATNVAARCAGGRLVSASTPRTRIDRWRKVMLGGERGPRARGRLARIASTVAGYGSLALGSLGVTAGRAVRGPLFAQISIADPCNHRCVMCPYHPPEVSSRDVLPKFGDVKPGIMSLDVFRSVVVDLARLGARRVDLVGRGEPLLNPHIVQMVALTRTLGLDVALTTNGSLLDAATVDALAGAGLGYVKVSLNAGLPETYPKIHVTETGTDHARVLEGVRRFTVRPSPRPHVTLSFAISSLNFGELVEMTERATEVGADAAYFQHLVPVASRPELTLSHDALLRVASDLVPRALEHAAARGIETNLTSFGDEARLAAGANGAGAPAVPCYVGYYFTVVLGNGNVMPCCQIERPLATLADAGFAEIWNGDAYRRFRHAARRLPVRGPELETAECESCYFRPHNVAVHRALHPFSSALGVLPLTADQGLRMLRLNRGARALDAADGEGNQSASKR